MTKIEHQAKIQLAVDFLNEHFNKSDGLSYVMLISRDNGAVDPIYQDVLTNVGDKFLPKFVEEVIHACNTEDYL